MKPLSVLLRADAGNYQGTGHVMRCMTLAEALIARGHTVTLMGALGDVPWLASLVTATGIRHINCVADELDAQLITASGFDWVVVDSYRIPGDAISELNLGVQCLAIIDGNTRGIDAALYLDQNLGATSDTYPEVSAERLLAGSSFALVREAVLAHRRPSPSSTISGRARVVAFMGGTDPAGAIVDAAESILAERLDILLDLVTPRSWIAQVQAAVSNESGVRVVETTTDLPSILGSADIVVSAAGTSAWDICSMARPAVFVALVENQRASINQIAKAGVALGLDAAPGGDGRVADLGSLLTSLLTNSRLRNDLVERCHSMFDGLGKYRVAEEMERSRRASTTRSRVPRWDTRPSSDDAEIEN